jgi:4-aminobutyrate--pyruvate transaminase
MVKNKATKEAFDPAKMVGMQAAKFCQEQGLVTRAVMDSVCFSPPLIITAAEVEEMFRRFGRALEATHGWIKEQGLLAA